MGEGLTGEDCSRRRRVSAEQHSSTGLITSYRMSSPRQDMAVGMSGGEGGEREDIPSAWAERTGGGGGWVGAAGDERDAHHADNSTRARAPDDQTRTCRRGPRQPHSFSTRLHMPYTVTRPPPPPPRTPAPVHSSPPPHPPSVPVAQPVAVLRVSCSCPCVCPCTH